MFSSYLINVTIQQIGNNVKTCQNNCKKILMYTVYCTVVSTLTIYFKGQCHQNSVHFLLLWVIFQNAKKLCLRKQCVALSTFGDRPIDRA